MCFEQGRSDGHVENVRGKRGFYRDGSRLATVRNSTGRRSSEPDILW